MLPQRLVLFVEGKGDKTAVPALTRRVLASAGGNDALFVDPDPFVVKGVGKLVKNSCYDWHRLLNAAGKTRKNVGAVLLVLDGDLEQVPKTWAAYVERFRTFGFCAYRVAATLAHEARSSRAGSAFSLATVFVMKEFEAWLIAGVESLQGIALAEGRGTVPETVAVPDFDIERKRDAKGVLRGLIPNYDQSLDQAILAANVDVAIVGHRCRSFRRLQSAVTQLVEAARTGKSIISPQIDLA